MGPYELAIDKISKSFERFGDIEDNDYIRSELLDTTINDLIDDFLDMVDLLREIKNILDSIGGI